MARKAQFNSWVIHTGRPLMRLMCNDLDDEYTKTKQSAKDGTLAPTTITPKPHAAAEALDYNDLRIEKITAFQADEEGRFILDNEEDTRTVIKELNKCYGGMAKVCLNTQEYQEWRGIKFHLDPNSPPIDMEEKKAPPKATKKTQ